MIEREKAFLGKGWGFPPTFNKVVGSVEMAEAEVDIRQSLYVLFSTIPGERMMRPDYGCNLHRHVFGSINHTLFLELKSLIADAILFFEPRITLEEIRIDADKARDGVLYIDLTYTIRQTNSRSNVVYPFYLTEGTNIRPV